MGLGYKTGSLQQFITLPRSHVCLKPTSISLEEAATISHRYTAIMVALLFKDGLDLPLEPTEEDKKKGVIVWGAASGSGMFAVQILKALGYQTILAVASPKQHAKLLKFGATEVFDRTDADLASKIQPKYPKLHLGLVAQIDPAGWQTMLDILKSTPEHPKTSVTIVHIIRRVPVIAKYLPKLLSAPNFAVPKEVQVVSEGSLLERVKSSLKIAGENTEVSLAIKVN